MSGGAFTLLVMDVRTTLALHEEGVQVVLPEEMLSLFGADAQLGPEIGSSRGWILEIHDAAAPNHLLSVSTSILQVQQ